MTEWADHSEELARKSLSALHDAMAPAADGTPQWAWRIYVIADTLSEVTQGLIPQRDWLVIDLIRKEARKVTFQKAKA